ncbi:hypothetical protein AMATHDRAFT_144890 [Amanita thiersii Skay4041]|uniref:HTH La-type RNA-binding domain-containing protein n=1 Tax=Amanita thiersii Skay4041 TaxID=703135 RepID=A0A2A9NRW7_9AGAR|nr:hypothetical protein AMATHDRAFT_144890 [Amanita thiersii Skay4041]
MGDPQNGYYPPPRQQVAPYVPVPYDTFPSTQIPPAAMPVQSQTQAPPMPAPTTQVSFPLDSISFWVLGQLEYYLSPQNLAQDFYLRQQMDSRGWIPITTLASFNRVKNLTNDYQRVRCVLLLSSMVQVRDDWVRMNGWERFVLPNATPSKIELPDGHADYGFVHNSIGGAASAGANGAHLLGAHERIVTEHGEEEDEEDDEEDVVFVMEKEAGWSPQAERAHT